MALPSKPLDLQVEDQIFANNQATVDEVTNLKQQWEKARTKGDKQAVSTLQQEIFSKDQPLYQLITAGLPNDDSGLRDRFREYAEYYRQTGNMEYYKSYRGAAARLSMDILVNSLHNHFRVMNEGLQHQGPASPAPANLDPEMLQNHQQQQGLGHTAPSFSFQPMFGNMNYQAPGYMASSAAYQSPYSIAPPQQNPYEIFPMQDKRYTDFTSPSVLLRDDVHNDLRFVNFTAVDFQNECHHSFYNREPIKHHSVFFSDRELNDFVMRVDDKNETDTSDEIEGYSGTPDLGDTIGQGNENSLYAMGGLYVASSGFDD